jgi:glycosyltransferase involved in cell wall biosynthesis
MNVLLLTPQLPYPPRQGAAIRNFSLIRLLARKHTVDLIAFLAPDETLAPDNPLHSICRRVEALPQPPRTTRQRARDTALSPLPDMAHRLDSPEMHQLVADALRSTPYDIVQLEGIEMAPYARHAIDTGVPFVFDNHNCEYLLQKRNAMTDLLNPLRWPAAGYSLIQWQKLVRYEAEVCKSAAAVLAVSQADADALHAIAPQAPITVITNGIDLAAYPPASHLTPDLASSGEGSTAHPTTPYSPLPTYQSPITSRPTLVFTGKMDYRPNVDAVMWFAYAVLPLVLAGAPTARFQIVGRNPHPRLDALRGHPNIEITGAVEDVQPYIDHAAVYIIPLRVGGGTRFKALEAMAAALPIVSTRLGVEGIGVTHERELLLADTPAAFAEAVLRLLDPAHADLAATLATNGRAFVEANYAWEPIVDRLDALYKRIVPAGKV